MGVVGLTTLLRGYGILPSIDKDHDGMNEFVPYDEQSQIRRTKIANGSTFSIDGSSFIFYIYRLAYYDHYKHTLSTYHSTKDDTTTNGQEVSILSTIAKLLPALLPLSNIESKTEIILSRLLSSGINIQIYLDGPLRRFKMETDKSRKESRATQETNLRQFAQSHVLSRQKKGKRLQRNSHIPHADEFLDNFPIPNLLFEQVIHTIHVLRDEYHEHTSPLYNTTTSSIEIIPCKEEADRKVALASANDLNNTTFCVGSDSDYFVYGYSFSSRQEFESMGGDPSVLYIPLEMLYLDGTDVEATVITRGEIASMFGVSQDLFLEASLLMGNDYTKPYVNNSTCWKSTNFYQDINAMNEEECCATSADDDYDMNGNVEMKSKRFKPKDILESLEEVSRLRGDWDDDGNGKAYTIKSDDAEFDLSIDFSRALYCLQDDLSSYPFDPTVNNADEELIRMITDGAIGATMTKPRVNYNSQIVKTVGEMVHNDSSLETLHHQILAPFESKCFCDYEDDDGNTLVAFTRKVLQMHGDHQIETSLDSELNQNSSSSQSNNATFMNCFVWENIVKLRLFEQVLSSVSRIRRENRVRSCREYSPCRLYDLEHFLHTCHEFFPHNNTGKNDCNSDSFGCTNDQNKTGLSIDDHKDTIINSIKNHRVTIIQGETGCGKSTRVPVMILDASLPDPDIAEVKMVICQPRRIAAKSLTERIRNTEPHLKDIIGLRMGHGYREYETKLTRAFVTTAGYLVRLLANHKGFFYDCTHIIIDEVHERSVDTDLLCLLTKRLLSTHPNIRLILMSATVAAERYQDYFDISQPPIFVGVRKFPIETIYLEDIPSRLCFSPKETKLIDEIQEKCQSLRCRSPPNLHYMAKLHELAVQIAVRVGKQGSSVLIFVPGIADIVAIMELFEGIKRSELKYKCIPLHSEVPFEEQMSVFKTAQVGEVKIVIGTNAAESSLTIRDIDHVICTGLCKQIIYNEKSHRQMLELSWISQASAQQRAGRTGRVRKGNVYRLYPKTMFENNMAPFELGEILRMPLDSLVLNLRTIIPDENVREILHETLEPPNLNHIERSLISLYESNFITEPNDCFTLTPLGSLVSLMGIDLSLGAIVGLGIILGLGSEAIEIAGILSLPQSPFLISNSMLQTPTKYNQIASKSFISKAKFDAGLFSEPLAIMNLLWDYSSSCKKETFCKKNSLSVPRMKRLYATISNLRDRVSSAIGIKVEDLTVKKPPRNMKSKQLMIIRFIQVWMFHDTMIYLQKPPALDKEDDEILSISLQGDMIKEDHLSSLFDSSRHSFELRNHGHIYHSGHYEPVEIDGYFPEIGCNTIEEPILSLIIERGVCTVIIFDSGINLYVPIRTETDTILKHLADSEFMYDCGSIICVKNHRRSGRGERDAGAWCKSTGHGLTENDTNSRCFKKFLYVGKASGLTSGFNSVRKKIRSKVQRSIALRLSDVTNDASRIRCFDLMAEGQGFHITTQDMADIFQTTREKVHMNVVSNNEAQKIIFYPDKIKRQPTVPNSLPEGFDLLSSTFSSTPPLFPSLPESFQLLSSVASSSYCKRPTLRFTSESNQNELSSDEGQVIETSFNQTKTSDRWKQVSNGCRVMVDGASIVATAAPSFNVTTSPIFACCPNILELNNGMLKVEGLTILPPGKHWLEAALRCIGLHTGSGLLGGDRSSTLTEQFHHTLQCIETESIEYCPTAVKLLNDVLDSIDKYLDNADELVKDQPDLLDEIKIQLPTVIESAKTAPISSECEVPQIQQSSDGQWCVSEESNQQVCALLNTIKKPRYFCPVCGDFPFKWKELREHSALAHDNYVICKEQQSELRLENRESFTNKEIEVISEQELEILSSPRHLQEVSNGGMKSNTKKKKRRYFCPVCGDFPFKWKQLKKHSISSHDGEVIHSNQQQCLLVENKDLFMCNSKEMEVMDKTSTADDVHHANQVIGEKDTFMNNNDNDLDREVIEEHKVLMIDKDSDENQDGQNLSAMKDDTTPSATSCSSDDLENLNEYVANDNYVGDSLLVNLSKEYKKGAVCHDSEQELNNCSSVHQFKSLKDPKQKSTEARKIKTSQQYFCPLCGHGPYKWKRLKKHALSLHDAKFNDNNQINFGYCCLNC